VKRRSVAVVLLPLFSHTRIVGWVRTHDVEHPFVYILFAELNVQAKVGVAVAVTMYFAPPAIAQTAFVPEFRQRKLVCLFVRQVPFKLPGSNVSTCDIQFCELHLYLLRR
jgi:hypothetical protein